MRTVRIALEVEVPDGYDAVADEELADHVAAGIATNAENLHFVESAHALEHRLLAAQPHIAPGETTVEAALFDAIRDHGQMHEDGAPVEDVLGEVARDFGREQAEAALATLERHGEVYQATDSTYRVTSQRDADSSP